MAKIHLVRRTSTRAFNASLLLGAVMRTASLLQVLAHTRRRGCRHLTPWPKMVSDDAFGYVLECCRIEDWWAVLVGVNRTLKTTQALGSTDGWWCVWTPTNSSTAGAGVVRSAASAWWRSRMPPANRNGVTEYSPARCKRRCRGGPSA